METPQTTPELAAALSRPTVVSLADALESLTGNHPPSPDLPRNLEALLAAKPPEPLREAAAQLLEDLRRPGRAGLRQQLRRACNRLTAEETTAGVLEAHHARDRLDQWIQELEQPWRTALAAKLLELLEPAIEAAGPEAPRSQPGRELTPVEGTPPGVAARSGGVPL